MEFSNATNGESPKQTERSQAKDIKVYRNRDDADDEEVKYHYSSLGH